MYIYVHVGRSMVHAMYSKRDTRLYLKVMIYITFIFSYVVSEPYSMVPGNRNWRYRVVDIHNGPSHLLPQLQEILEGRKANDLPGLTVRID